MIQAEFASKIDYSNIQAYKVTDRDCEALALKARVYGIGTIVVSPASIAACEKHILDQPVKLAVSVAYPSGAYTADSKGAEIRELVNTYPRIDEFYAVMAVGLFLEGEIGKIREELAAIAQAASGRCVKLVTEIALMDREQKEILCTLAAEAHIPYIVTSTGFKPYDVPLPSKNQIRELVEAADGRIKVVACSEIQTREQALDLLSAGADRIFTDCAMELIFG